MKKQLANILIYVPNVDIIGFTASEYADSQFSGVVPESVISRWKLEGGLLVNKRG